MGPLPPAPKPQPMRFELEQKIAGLEATLREHEAERESLRKKLCDWMIDGRDHPWPRTPGEVDQRIAVLESHLISKQNALQMASRGGDYYRAGANALLELVLESGLQPSLDRKIRAHLAGERTPAELVLQHAHRLDPMAVATLMNSDEYEDLGKAIAKMRGLPG